MFVNDAAAGGRKDVTAADSSKPRAVGDDELLPDAP